MSDRFWHRAGQDISVSLPQILRQAGGESQAGWMILTFQPIGIDAPKRREINHIVFIGESAAAILPNFRPRFTSGGISRVVYDVTSKPPGTIEWE